MTPRTSQALRIIGLLSWSALCLGMWLTWSASTVGDIAPEDPAGATGAVVGAACAAGCTGSVWLGGLVVMALVWALVRR